MKATILSPLLLAAFIVGSCNAADDDTRCGLKIDRVEGRSGVDVFSDQLVLSFQITSSSAGMAGDTATKLKELVEAENIDGMMYRQSFHQLSHWDSKTRKNLPGDWEASAMVTLPFDQKLWKATGSTMMNTLISKALALGADKTSSSRRLRHLLTQGAPYAAPVSGDPAVRVSLSSTFFQVSRELREKTEKLALTKAVSDAIDRIGHSAAPFLSAAAQQSFGVKSLSNVVISNTPAISPVSYRSFATQSMEAAPDISSTTISTYVVPDKQQITQTATVSACVN